MDKIGFKVNNKNLEDIPNWLNNVFEGFLNTKGNKECYGEATQKEPNPGSEPDLSLEFNITVVCEKPPGSDPLEATLETSTTAETPEEGNATETDLETNQDNTGFSEGNLENLFEPKYTDSRNFEERSHDTSETSLANTTPKNSLKREALEYKGPIAIQEKRDYEDLRYQLGLIRQNPQWPEYLKTKQMKILRSKFVEQYPNSQYANSLSPYRNLMYDSASSDEVNNSFLERNLDKYPSFYNVHRRVSRENLDASPEQDEKTSLDLNNEFQTLKHRLELIDRDPYIENKWKTYYKLKSYHQFRLKYPDSDQIIPDLEVENPERFKPPATPIVFGNCDWEDEELWEDLDFQNMWRNINSYINNSELNDYERDREIYNVIQLFRQKHPETRYQLPVVEFDRHESWEPRPDTSSDEEEELSFNEDRDYATLIENIRIIRGDPEVPPDLKKHRINNLIEMFQECYPNSQNEIPKVPDEKKPEPVISSSPYRQELNGQSGKRSTKRYNTSSSPESFFEQMKRQRMENERLIKDVLGKSMEYSPTTSPSDHSSQEDEDDFQDTTNQSRNSALSTSSFEDTREFHDHRLIKYRSRESAYDSVKENEDYRTLMSNLNKIKNDLFGRKTARMMELIEQFRAEYPNTAYEIQAPNPLNEDRDYAIMSDVIKRLHDQRFMPLHIEREQVDLMLQSFKQKYPNSKYFEEKTDESLYKMQRKQERDTRKQEIYEQIYGDAQDYEAFEPLFDQHSWHNGEPGDDTLLERSLDQSPMSVPFFLTPECSTPIKTEQDFFYPDMTTIPPGEGEESYLDGRESLIPIYESPSTSRNPLVKYDFASPLPPRIPNYPPVIDNSEEPGLNNVPDPNASVEPFRPDETYIMPPTGNTFIGPVEENVKPTAPSRRNPVQYIPKYNPNLMSGSTYILPQPERRPCSTNIIMDESLIKRMNQNRTRIISNDKRSSPS